MNISYDNSMYTVTPPTPMVSELTPNELMEDAVEEFLYEQKYFHSYIDLEEIRNRELIENGKSQRIIIRR